MWKTWLICMRSSGKCSDKRISCQSFLSSWLQKHAVCEVSTFLPVQAKKRNYKQQRACCSPPGFPLHWNCRFISWPVEIIRLQHLQLFGSKLQTLHSAPELPHRSAASPSAAVIWAEDKPLKGVCKAIMFVGNIAAKIKSLEFEFTSGVGFFIYHKREGNPLKCHDKAFVMLMHCRDHQNCLQNDLGKYLEY